MFFLHFYPRLDLNSFLLESELIVFRLVCRGVWQWSWSSALQMMGLWEQTGRGCAVHEALNVLIDNLHSLDTTAVHV